MKTQLSADSANISAGKLLFGCCRRQGSASRHGVLPFLFSALLLLLALLLTAGPAPAANTASTLFLPLQVIAPAEPEALQDQADEIMTRLGPEHGFRVLSREELPPALADSLADAASWPPTAEELRELSPPAGVRYLVAGSLTRFGNQVSIDATVFDLHEQQPPRIFTGQAGSPEQLLGNLAAFGEEILEYTEPVARISAVYIEGNEKTGAGAILRRVASRSGDRLDPERLREDLRAIHAMGFFDDVQLLTEEFPEGTRVTFVVKEKPVIGQVVISGNDKVKESDIRESIAVIPQTIVNPPLVLAAEESIRQLYKEKGYHDTEVSSEIVEVSAERVNVRFEIEEGERVFIRAINFTGNESFGNRPLRKAIQTKTKGWFSWLTKSGRLQTDILEQDRARLAAFYHNHGFIDARVGEPEVELEDSRLTVAFNIEEGPRYRVGQVTLAGEFLAPEEELLALVELQKEEYFSREVLREDIIRLSDRYAEEGYAYADVEPVISRDDDNLIMDVELHLYKDILVHINRIIIRGNTRTRDNVIRREIRVREGDIMDTGAIRKSMESLQQLNYFEEVNIEPRPALMQDDLMDLEIEVKEQPTGAFSIGAGYSSMDKIMFMGEISQDNFRGRGQRLALQADISSKAARYNLSFTDPRVDDSQLLFGFDLYNWRREYTDYTKESTGGAVRFGYPVWELWRAYWGYGYETNKMTNVSPNASLLITQSMELKTNSYARLGVNRDTRDNRLDPTRGSYHDIGTKHGGGWLGGDTAYTRVEASTTWFFPWERIPVLKESRSNWLNDSTFRLKGAAGYVRENESGKLPIYEKFFLGGLRTMRGFEVASISPRDSGTNERIGGEKMFYMNSEWIFPLVRDLNLKGLIFYDTGNVYTKNQGWDLGDLKSSVGVGFRWLSPMGPLRLEWGYNLDPEPDESRTVWDFSIGGVF